MGVFNNLIMYDQHVRKTACNRSCPIWRRAGHGTSEGTELTFSCGTVSKFHDGKPFRRRMEMPWDLRLDQAPENCAVNPGKSTFYNLAEVTTNGDWEVRLPPDGAASRRLDAARRRLLGDLSLPRCRLRDAPSSYRPPAPFKFGSNTSRTNTSK